MKKILLRLTLFFATFFGLSFLLYLLFKPLYYSNDIIFSFAITPFNIAKVYPKIWLFIKNSYFVFMFVSYTIIFNYLYSTFQKYYFFKSANPQKEPFLVKHNTGDLELLIGKNQKGNKTFLQESGLYQNILITGTIGSGKTSSAMYPFTNQLINYKHDNQNEKLAMLVLDVKGNYYKEVLGYAKSANRLDDIILIELGGFYKYNPLDKPDLKPIVLANRLKTILTLFSPNSSENYWLDKAEQILAECIKLCRLYNNRYVTFSELHKLIMFEDYYKEKIEIVRNLFISGNLKDEDIYNLSTCIDFFEKEFFGLDSRTLSILKSEIIRITNIFVSDYAVSSTFCPSKENINFMGFKSVLESGKIVVLNMNIAEYKNLSKIIATYLKLDFQTEVMSRLGKNSTIRKSVFISDEFHEYVTLTDSDFFAQSREAKCINIVATQSYTSIQNAIKNETATKVILQNLINKIWFRTDDIFTIEEAQKQIGKEEKEKISTTISENAKETNFSFITNSLVSKDSSLSESYNKYTQSDYVFDTNFFSQNLKTFEALTFLSSGFNILKPEKLEMLPYFRQKED